jgi:two-component system sensor histidine kinase MprB
VLRPHGDAIPLPVSAADLQIAQGRRGRRLEDRTVGADRLRVITEPVPHLGAVQLGRSLSSVDGAVGTERLVLGLLVVCGVGIAALAGRVFSRSVLGPIAGLMGATSHIQATGDLSLRVDDARSDEVGRLASSFNAMLDQIQAARDALADSTTAQRQLVADASHELRTPVAGLRTNLEVLLSGRIRPAEREALIADAVGEIDELPAIVSDLIELARGDAHVAESIDLDLADIVREALARLQLHARDRRVQAEVEPWPMIGSPERLGRAVNNLLDNAVKFGTPDTAIVVSLRGGVLRVRNDGRSVAPDDLPHIFDRFHRGRGTSTLPGSGLGLAIVRQVAESHGGSVSARAGARGGLEVTLRLPGAPGSREVRRYGVETSVAL